MNKTKIFLLVIVVLVVGVIWQATKNKSAYERQETPTQSEPFGMGDQSTPIATFKGYYTVIKNVYGEENTGPFDCDAFIVEKNNDPLFQFLALWAPGTILPDGNMRLTIYMGENSHVSSSTREKILASTSKQPISLTVQKIKFEGKGLPACGSVVDILSAQQ